MRFNNLYTAILLPSVLMFCAGCSSSFEGTSSFPAAVPSGVHASLADKVNPTVSASYCIENNLNDNINLNRVEFTLSVNGLVIDNQVETLDTGIDSGNRLCKDIVFRPDVVHNPEASSTLLNTMLKRTFAVDSVLYYDNEEIKPTVSHIDGVLY